MKKILIILLLLLSGCTCFEDKRVRVEFKPDMTSAKYKEALSNLINNRYTNEYLMWIRADLALAEYELSRKE